MDTLSLNSFSILCLATLNIYCAPERGSKLLLYFLKIKNSVSPVLIYIIGKRMASFIILWLFNASCLMTFDPFPDDFVTTFDVVLLSEALGK